MFSITSGGSFLFISTGIFMQDNIAIYLVIYKVIGGSEGGARGAVPPPGPPWTYGTILIPETGIIYSYCSKVEKTNGQIEDNSYKYTLQLYCTL